jgi:hypothetical protein
MTDPNQLYNKLTKPIRDSQVNKVFENLTIKENFPFDQEFNFSERLKTKNKMIEIFIPWTKNFLGGLENFNQKYIVNGNSDAINMVLLSQNFNKIYYLQNEYTYYSHICKNLNLTHQEIQNNDIDFLTPNDLFLISMPSSYNGDVEEKILMIKKLQQKGVKIFIDIAYCGLTNPFYLNLEVTKNTYVSFTFSKTASLSYNRIGILFSDFTIPGLDIMNKIGYLNLAGANAAIAFMNNFPVDYFYKKYHEQYLEICQTNQLTPTKCILFGHTNNGEKFCTTPFYKHN